MKDFEDAMMDIAWKNYDSENKRFKDIDAKAIGVITITGILMTFLSKTDNHSEISTALFILTSVSFLGTILFSVKTIKVRGSEALSTDYLIQDLKNENTMRQIRGMIATIAAAEDSQREVCNEKAGDLSCAVYGLGISIILLILYSLSNFVGINFISIF